MDLSNVFILSVGLIFAYFTKFGGALQCLSCSSMGRPPSYCQNSVDLSNVTYVECSYKFVQAFIQSVNSAQSLLNGNYGKTLGYMPHEQPEEYSCAKTVLEGNNKDAEPVVIRGCVARKKKDALDACTRLREYSIAIATAQFTLYHCEECTSDKCNGGSGATPSTLGAMLVSTLAVLYLSRG